MPTRFAGPRKLGRPLPSEEDPGGPSIYKETGRHSAPPLPRSRPDAAARGQVDGEKPVSDEEN